MAYNLEEQEQLELVKSWWKQYGNLVILAVVVAVLTASTLYGWRYYRHQQAQAAATLYQQLRSAESLKDAKRVRDIAVQIIDKYGSTPYAGMAALASAQASFDAGDLDSAKTQLQWVIDHAKEEEMRDVARLRLAGVLLDGKKYAEALALMAVKPVDAFAGLYANMKGDILVAQDKPGEARSAYRLALAKGEPQSQYHMLVQLKLDALGEEK